MAVMWTGGVITYGWGANALGRLGPTLRWSMLERYPHHHNGTLWPLHPMNGMTLEANR